MNLSITRFLRCDQIVIVFVSSKRLERRSSQSESKESLGGSGVWCFHNRIYIYVSTYV